jgi:dolichol-phosphate mannosyltransferase
MKGSDGFLKWAKINAQSGEPRMSRELSVIVPTLNEQDNIVPLLEKLHNALDGINWEVIFVDDSSVDATSDIIEGICQKDDRVYLVKRGGRHGLSSAVIEGLRQSQAPFLAVMDADLQHDEALLKEMFNLLKNDPLDIVIASRYVTDAELGPWPKSRVFMSQAATGLVRTVLGIEIKDPLSGFFMMKRALFEQAVPALCGRGQKILLDLYLSVPGDVRFKELPLRFKGRVSGKSKLNLKVVWENFCLLIIKMVR